MPDKKISGLPPAAAAAVTDQHEVNQGGVSKKLTNTQILDLVSNGAYSFSGLQVNGDAGVTGNFVMGNPNASILLADGSAVFAQSGLSLGIDVDGTLHVGGPGLAALYIFNVDGTGLITSEPIRTNSKFDCNGLDGVTGDFNILDGAVPKVFHFEGGILTSVT